MNHGVLIKRVVLALSFLPLLRWFYLYSQDALGLDSALWMMESSGQTAFVMLCLTLVITPLRQLLSFPLLIWCRRPLGVMTFFYAFCHFVIWVGAERRFSFALMGRDIVERPFISLGVLALIILAVLASTSHQMMVRKLGRRWQQLHRGVYVVAVLVALHFLMMQRVDESAMFAYLGAAVIGLLLLWRIVFKMRQHRLIQQKMFALKPDGIGNK